MSRHTVTQNDCPTDQYLDPANGCKSCSQPENQYQEVLCPCEPTRDSVIGCKSSISNEDSLCTSRSVALEQCAERYETPSVALSTTDSTLSTSMSSSLPPHSTAFVPASTDFTESTPPNSVLYTTQHPTDNPQSILSDVHLKFILAGSVAFLVLVLTALAAYIKRKRHRRRTFDVEEHEEMQSSRNSRDVDSAYNSADVDVAETQQSPHETSSTAAGEVSRHEDEQDALLPGHGNTGEEEPRRSFQTDSDPIEVAAVSPRTSNVGSLDHRDEPRETSSTPSGEVSRQDDEQDALLPGDGNSGEGEPRRSCRTDSDPIDAAAVPPRTSDVGSSDHSDEPNCLFQREDKQHLPLRNSCSFTSDDCSRTMGASTTTVPSGDAFICVGHVHLVDRSADERRTSSP